MAEYIEKAKVFDFPIRKDRYDEENGSQEYVFGIEAVLEYVETIPTADVVKVVRCKYCKHRADGLYCRLRKTPVIVTNFDFCSYGERKEDA